MFTVITKGNDVRQYTDSEVNVYRNIKNNVYDYIIIHDDGLVASNKGNPITWPTDASDGLQAIVDVKAGTLRFGYDGWPWSATEFLVSNYVKPVTSAPHVFDLVDYWPDQRNKEPGLDAPEGWEWKYFGDDWCLSNGLVGLKHDDWFKYKFGDPQPTKPFVPFVSAEDSAPVHVLDLIKEWPKSMPPQRELESVDGHKWEYFHGKWVLSSKLSDREFHEGHWLNYHENKKKYAEPQPENALVTAASMLTAALGHMEDRAKTYDAPGGERSMGKTVAAFNVITGHKITVEQGYLFMVLLKSVRAQQGSYKSDNYEDGAAYFALMGEEGEKERGNT